MIGHYLLTLCPEAEHDVLTGNMVAGAYGTEDRRCLVGWAADVWSDGKDIPKVHRYAMLPRRGGVTPTAAATVEGRYDTLCDRFGTARVNAAIRNRILSNMARRILHGVTAPEVAVHG